MAPASRVRTRMILLELLHEVPVAVEPAGGVDDDHVGADLLAMGEGTESDGGRVRFGLPADEIGSDPIGPRLELLGCPGPERVGRPENDPLAFRGQSMRQLGNGRCLAGPVDPHDDHECRRAVGPERPVPTREQIDQFVPEGVVGGGRVCRAASPDPLDDGGGGGYPDIAGDEGLFELGPEGLVDRAPSE